MAEGSGSSRQITFVDHHRHANLGEVIDLPGVHIADAAGRDRPGAGIRDTAPIILEQGVEAVEASRIKCYPGFL